MLYLCLFEALLRIQWICWCNNSRAPHGGAIFIWIWRQDIRAVCPNMLSPCGASLPTPLLLFPSIFLCHLPANGSQHHLYPLISWSQIKILVCVVLLVSLSLSTDISCKSLSCTCILYYCCTFRHKCFSSVCIALFFYLCRKVSVHFMDQYDCVKVEEQSVDESKRTRL